MRLLHTSDWHVGKSIRGLSRADEHRAVLAEMVAIAVERAVDVFVVAGDLFESSAPSPEAEAIVYEALLSLSARDIQVLVISGNHDNARRFEAIRPILALARVHVVARPTRPDDGGVVTLSTDNGTASFALLPFVSQRGIVRADQLMADAAFEHVQSYAERISALVDVLVSGCPGDVPPVVIHHGFVTGGTVGGGERLAHLANAYHLSALAFPPRVAYVALGHLHRAQKIPGAAPIHYSGSPLMLDFGESDDLKSVTVVDIPERGPAKVERVPLHSGRALLTVRGPIDQLMAMEVPDDPWLRVVVEGARTAEVAHDVRSHFGERTVEVRVENRDTPHRRSEQHTAARQPADLFAEYLRLQGIADPGIDALFAELLEEASTADAEPVAQPAGPRSDQGVDL